MDKFDFNKPGHKEPLERIADSLERLEGKVDLNRRFDRIEGILGVILDGQDVQLEQGDKEMAFTEEVLAKISEQTTRLDSIDTALEALVASGTITQENKDAIMAAFGTSDAQLSRAEAALGANVPPTP